VLALNAELMVAETIGGTEPTGFPRPTAATLEDVFFKILKEEKKGSHAPVEPASHVRIH